MSFAITDLKKGTVFSFEGQPYRVIDYSQKVMGRGGSIVNVKIKSLVDGKTLEKTFKGSDQLDSADVGQQTVQYLYSDTNSYNFMNSESFEQFSVPSNLIGDSGLYIKEGDHVDLQLFEAKPIGIVLPKNVALKVVYTESVVRGDTSSSLTKDARLETGLVIKVPSFIKQDDLVSVDTTSGIYRERIRL